MPLRSQMAATSDEAMVDAEEAASNATDVETEVSEQPVEPVAAIPRRRWFSLRRKPEAPRPDEVPDTDATTPVEDPKPASPVPVGKSRRATKAAEPIEVAAAPATDAADEVGDADADATVGAEGDEAPAVEQVMVPHQPAGRRLTMAAVAAGVLFVAGAAFAGATVQPYLADRADVDIKLNVARTAASAITTLWTYTPDNLESLPDRSAHFLGGDFANEYRKYIDAIVAPNKQAQVTNTTQVMGTAVETLNPNEATAIVYTNSVATSPVTKNIPSLRYLSYRLTMQRHDADWLITKMSTVTSLDLTPQL